MSNKLRLITFLLLAPFFIFIGISYFASIKEKPQVAKPTTIREEQKKATLVLDFGNGEARTYEYTFTDKKTAYDALKETAEKENISLETQQYNFGVFVKSIGGKETSAEIAWIYFVNGEAGQVAADQYILQDGDRIEWKFIKPE